MAKQPGIHQRVKQMFAILITDFFECSIINQITIILDLFPWFCFDLQFHFSPLYSTFCDVNCSLKKKWACCEKSFTENDFLFRNLPTTVKIFMAIQVIKLLRIVITLRIVSHDENWFHMPGQSSRPKSSTFFMKHSIALKHI